MELLSWGANSHGQLGLGYETEMCISPQCMTGSDLPFLLDDIKKIVGGGGHTMILTNSGQLYGCGWNNKGQLGLGNTKNFANFQKLTYFNDKFVKNIYCGWDSTAALVLENSGIENLYVWGSNYYQQLGFNNSEPDNLKNTELPKLLQLPNSMDRIKSFSFGLTFSSILTLDNQIYLLGKIKSNFLDNCSQLADNSAKLQSIQYNNINILCIKFNNEIIENIVCGQNHLIYTTIQLNHDGQEENIYRITGFGNNKYGQCNGFTLTSNINGENIKCGWTHNCVILSTDDSNELLLWGRNNYGQLGTSSSNECESKKLIFNDRIKSIHLGSEHCLMVTEQGTLYTWGWNEHGNCGNNSVDNVLSPYNVSLPPGGKCILAGTGAGFCYAVIKSNEQLLALRVEIYRLSKMLSKYK